MSSIALVLSAGGPRATAFHAGALAALLDDAGWDARAATLIVGTSAGSSAAAILRGGFSPRDEYARVTSGSLSAEGRQFTEKVRENAPTDSPQPPPSGFRPLGLRMALAGLLPHRFRPGLTMA